MALIKLTPKANYLSMREKHKKECRRYDLSMSKREREIYGISDWSTRFDDLFVPTEIIGIYMSYFDADVINIWCKQYAYYGRKFFKQLRKIEDINERIAYHRNCWTYGVADNLQQIVDFYNANEDGYFNGNHVISCFEVHRNVDEPCSGWRWHKWGQYIGTQNPKCEYLNDEPEIEKVICFSIYKVR